MTDRAVIIGMGWVTPASMGYPGNVLRRDGSGRRPDLSGKTVLTEPWKSFGRMDDFSKTGFSAIAFAMAHAGMPPAAGSSGSQGGRRPVPLIAESFTGCLETDLAYQATLRRHGTVMPSPALFAYTLPSSFLGEAAIYFGLTGEAYMIDTAARPGLTALALAMDSLKNCDTAICGVCNSDMKTLPGNEALCDPATPAGLATPNGLFLVLARDTDRPNSDIRTTILRKHPDQFSTGDGKITALTDLVQKENL